MAMFNSYVTVYQRVTGFVSSPFTEIEHGWTWDVQANPVAGGNLCEPCHPAPCTGTRLFDWNAPQPFNQTRGHSLILWWTIAVGLEPPTWDKSLLRHWDISQGLQLLQFTRTGLVLEFLEESPNFTSRNFIPLIPQSSVGRLPMPNCPCSEEPQT